MKKWLKVNLFNELFFLNQINDIKISSFGQIK